MQLELPKPLLSMDLLARRLAALSPLSDHERSLLLNCQQHCKCNVAGSEISGGPDHLQTMQSDIYVPADFSPIR